MGSDNSSGLMTRNSSPITIGVKVKLPLSYLLYGVVLGFQLATNCGRTISLAVHMESIKSIG